MAVLNAAVPAILAATMTVRTVDYLVVEKEGQVADSGQLVLGNHTCNTMLTVPVKNRRVTST